MANTRRKYIVAVFVGLGLTIGGVRAAAELSADWMIPAAAHNPGSSGTFWKTDLSIHNPHEYDLPVVIQALESDTENFDVPSLFLTLAPWETLNLWDVLGPDVFDIEGTAALLVYADPELDCDPIETCHLLVSSRTYTPDGSQGDGEFGLTVSGAQVERGATWDSFAYATGILNDGQYFRCNAGIASWSEGWISVRVDLQDASGFIVDSTLVDVPPFGHTQWRLPATDFGGTVVFYLESGPSGSVFFSYATPINQDTGDPSYQFAEPSVVGVSVAKGAPTPAAERPASPGTASRVELQQRAIQRSEPD